MKKFSIFIIFLLIIVAGTFVFIKQTPSFKQTKGDKVEHQLIVTLLPQKQIVKKLWQLSVLTKKKNNEFLAFLLITTILYYMGFAVIV